MRIDALVTSLVHDVIGRGDRPPVRQGGRAAGRQAAGRQSGRTAERQSGRAAAQQGSTHPQPRGPTWTPLRKLCMPKSKGSTYGMLIHKLK